MAGPHAIRILVVDDDAGLLDDYRRILNPGTGPRDESLFAQLESDLIGAAASAAPRTSNSFLERHMVIVLPLRHSVATSRTTVSGEYTWC